MKSKLACLVGLCIAQTITFNCYANTKNLTTNHTSVETKINALQREIDELKHEQLRQKKTAQKALVSSKKNITSTCHHKEANNNSRILIGPYLNRDRLFDGSELLTNVPSVREAARLLENTQKLMNRCANLGIPYPSAPYLTLSGYIEGQTGYTDSYHGASTANIDLDAAELDIHAQINSWISGFIAIDYDEGDNDNLFMNRAFITIGNLNVTPLYASIGKVYTPFGRYSSNMVTEPMTQDIGRIRANTLTLGYQQVSDNALHAELYAYQGLTNAATDDNTRNEWGADLGYQFSHDVISGEIGTSIISNMADSQGAQDGSLTNTAITSSRVPGIAEYLQFAISQFNLIVEYITAIDSFDNQDMVYANHDAKPSAFNVEGSYNFSTMSKPSSVAIGYGRSYESLAYGIPAERYSAVYNINIFRATNFALEYRHDINYSSSAASNRY